MNFQRKKHLAKIVLKYTFLFVALGNDLISDFLR